MNNGWLDIGESLSELCGVEEEACLVGFSLLDIRQAIFDVPKMCHRYAENFGGFFSRYELWLRHFALQLHDFFCNHACVGACDGDSVHFCLVFVVPQEGNAPSLMLVLLARCSFSGSFCGV